MVRHSGMGGKVVECISLFSGAGGLDIGAEQAGAKISICVENDPDAAETLRLNMDLTKSEVAECDIAGMGSHRFRGGRKTILIGGPPCQPFSKNGYWVKNENRLIVRDPRNKPA